VNCFIFAVELVLPVSEFVINPVECVISATAIAKTELNSIRSFDDMGCDVHHGLHHRIYMTPFSLVTFG
jgi:hypothetical protein